MTCAFSFFLLLLFSSCSVSLSEHSCYLNSLGRKTFSSHAEHTGEFDDLKH